MKKQTQPAKSPDAMPMRRVRPEALPKSRRTFITQHVAMAPMPAVDTQVPMMGQRKRKKPRRAKLLPNPQV